MMKKITIQKIRWRIDNPGGRALYSFFKKSEGKDIDSKIKTEVLHWLAANLDWNSVKIEINGKEFTTFVEYIRQRAEANDREFFKRLGRALTKRRKFKNTEIEDFLFKFWDTTETNAGGLEVFTDEAVWELLQIKFEDRAPSSLQAYREIRKRVGLSPLRPPKIRQVTQERDGSAYARAR